MATIAPPDGAVIRTMLPSKILIPVDGSENSRRAADFAIELAKRLGSSVVFLNVMEIPISVYKYRRVAEGVLELLQENGRIILANFGEYATKKGVPCEAVLSHGDPSSQILVIAKRKKCDCIVIGKRGLGRIQRMLLGSVSDQVTRLSDIPVITVK